MNIDKYFFYSITIIIITLILSCNKNSGSSTSSSTISITDVSQERSSTSSTIHFNISITPASTKDITVSYTTVSGTAKENVDFKPINGTLTIPSGNTNAGIDITITGDSTRKTNQIFYLQLSNPSNGVLSNQQATATIINENNNFLSTDSTGYSTPKNYVGYSLVWSDEFNTNQIDPNNWTYDMGNSNGWGNSELEFYTNNSKNSFVSNGNLIIEARNEIVSGFNYTSARMKTQGLKSFTYGRIDIRAKLPKGQGIWPALWMLGSNINTIGWPSCGEIDIMEMLGQEPNKIYGTLHWGSSSATHQSSGTNYTLASSSFDQQFHVYSLLWQKDSTKIMIDDKPYFSIASNQITPSNPFNQNFFFIFNIAVGGSWPGKPDNTTIFPQRMFVDYVRVFQ